MNPGREDIIRMAREAEIHTYPEWMHGVPIVALERFAALVAAAEREACAKVCDEAVAELIKAECNKDLFEVAIGLRDAIRARGQA